MANVVEFISEDIICECILSKEVSGRTLLNSPTNSCDIKVRREKLKNKFRLFYYKNAKFLNIIFDPIMNFFIICFGKIVNLINIPKNDNQNLMSKNSKSVV